MDLSPDTLPTPQYLILEVLAARWRLGEQAWTFPSRLTSQMRGLEHLGAIWWKSGSRDGTVLAGLTDAGRDAVLSPTYMPPLVERVQHELEMRPDPVAQPDAYYAT